MVVKSFSSNFASLLSFVFFIGQETIYYEFKSEKNYSNSLV